MNFTNNANDSIQTADTNKWEERDYWRLHNNIVIESRKLPNGRYRTMCAWSYDNDGIVKCVVESKGMLTEQDAKLVQESAYSSGQFDFKGGIWIHRKATDDDKEFFSNK